jgi:filamentous hemagglutinin
MLVDTVSGKPGEVESISRRDGRFTVYNIEVGQLHTYYVSSLGILAHNQNCSVGSGSVWNMDPIDRGLAIQSDLAATDYGDWYNVGAEGNGTFPLVDFQQGNDLVSLKTVDTNGSTWMGRMEEHIDDLGDRGAEVSGQPANMILDMRVQPGGAAAAQYLVGYGLAQGVTVKISVYP